MKHTTYLQMVTDPLRLTQFPHYYDLGIVLRIAAWSFQMIELQ